MTHKLKKGPDITDDVAIPPERQEFAANLIRFRKTRGMTQDELSDASGVNQSHISKLERGAWDPRLSTIMALSAALGIAPADLLPSFSLKPNT